MEKKNVLCKKCGTYRFQKDFFDEIKKRDMKSCDNCRKKGAMYREKYKKEQKFKCDACKQCFGDNKDLQRHIDTVHLGKKNYKCEYCEKCFGQNGSLQLHIDTVHLGEKNYKCEYCEKCFGRKEHLQKHTKICTGETNMSSPERNIKHILEDLNIDFLQEHRFNDCRNILPLPFDFWVEDLNLAMEFDGITHDEPIYGEEIFQKQQKCDKIKTQYCKDNNITLLRIDYKNMDTMEEQIIDQIYKIINF